MRNKKLIAGLTALALIVAALVTAFVLKDREQPPVVSPLTVEADAWELTQAQARLKNIQFTEHTDGSYDLYAPVSYVKKEGGAARLNPHGSAGAYSCTTAPILIFADETPAVKPYLDEGFVVVTPSLKTEDCGEGTARLKAVVRHLRYNKTVIAGCTARIFVIARGSAAGMAAALGASGNASLYTPLLTADGAAMNDAIGIPLSDAVAGVLCCDPVTCQDTANLSYEWCIGQFTDAQGREKDSYRSALSADLAAEYGAFINKINIKNPEGLSLKLENENGVYQKGSYYDYVMYYVNGSLNNYLKAHQISAKAYCETHQAVPDGDGVKYLSLRDFTQSCITPQREPAADCPDLYTAALLRNNARRYAKYGDFDKGLSGQYEKALLEKDDLGVSARDRANRINPMYYLSAYYGGYTKSTPAKYWLITNRIDRGDASLTDALNLKLLLTRSPYVDEAVLQMKWDGEKPQEDSIIDFVRNACRHLSDKDEAMMQTGIGVSDTDNPFSEDVEE